MKLKNTIFVFIAMALIAVNCPAEEEKAERVVKSLSFDPRTAVVSYELTHPAKVRVRMGTKEGPLFRTIIDWQERGIGKHSEDWDGMDASGKIKLLDNYELVFTFNYYTKDDAYLKNATTEDIMPHPEQVMVGRFLPSLDINRIHKKHEGFYCHDPALTVKLPKDARFTKDGRVIVKDNMPLAVDIADNDKLWFGRERYSIHVFIDDIFLTGELEGYSPYNFVFDAGKTSSGNHLLTVNYSGFNDHIAIASIPIFIEKPGERIAKTK